MRLSSLLISVSALSLSGLASLAHAEEAGSANLILNMPVLTYGSSSKEVKPDGGTSSKAKTDTLVTANNADSYAELTFGNCAVYLYPFSGLKQVSLGYLPTPMFEVGIDLGIDNAKTDKPKDESNSTTIGVYGFVYPKLGSMDSEAGLIIDSTTTKGTRTEMVGTTETEVKTNGTNMNTRLVANVILPVRKNLSYVGGFSYNMNSDDDKEGKVKTTTSGLGLNLATFRITLD